MNKLLFDYNFASEERLPGGISRKALKICGDKAGEGLKKLRDMAEKGLVGFPDLVNQDLSSIKKLASEVRGRFDDLIVAGIGGSALGIEAVVNALLPYGYNALGKDLRGGFPRIWVADNTDPSKISGILEHCSPESTFTVVISKSGSTVETAANFSVIFEWLKNGVKDISGHIAVITDPEKGNLRAFANDNGLPVFDIAPSVGGRFSVLSPVGLLPAALMGVDIDKLLKGAADVTAGGYDKILTACAVYIYFMEKGRSINVLMPYSSRLEKFAEWFCQLWGESLGKKNTYSGKTVRFGTTPLRTVGAIDQHSQIQLFREGPLDKTVTFIGVKSHSAEKTIKGAFHKGFSYLEGVGLGELLNSELKATEAALLTSGVPSVRMDVDVIDEYSLGQLFMFFQYIVPVIGLSADINPFDQPGVEEAKEYAYGMMDRKGFEAKKSQFEEIYKKSDDFVL